MIPSQLQSALSSDPELRTSLHGLEALRSAVLLDMIFWNVVIAFVVNVSASVAYDAIRARLAKNDEWLNGREIAKLRPLMNEPIEGYDATRIENAIRAASRLLEDQNIPAAETVVRRAIEAAKVDQ